jgi:hypothetical protein
MSFDGMLSGAMAAAVLYLYLLWEKKSGSPQAIALVTSWHRKATKVGLITLASVLGLLLAIGVVAAVLAIHSAEPMQDADIRAYLFLSGAVRFSCVMSLIAYGIARLIVRRGGTPIPPPGAGTAFPPSPPPDFSTLSDGNQITTNLEQIGDDQESNQQASEEGGSGDRAGA